MEIKNFANHQEERIEIGVWFCEMCERFHLKVGNVLMTFTKTEFGEFADSISDCRTANIDLKDFSLVH